MLYSGSVAGGNNGETVPPTTTVPPNVDTTPILASEIQAECAEE
jgi:hypothetical protein